MKKSLLALAVLATATTANAATVYDKDGTTLDIGGRVQAVAYSGHFGAAGEEDSSLANSARFNVGGTVKANDYVSGYAFTEWDTSDGIDNDKFSARDQYLGLDFNEFGKLQFGKQLNSIYDAQAATDVFEEVGGVVQGSSNSDYRVGNFRYIFENSGFNASASLQTATNNAVINGNEEQAVNSGYSLGLGYTFENVVFGPLSVQLAYDYVNGQNDYADRHDLTNSNDEYSFTSFDNFRHQAASIAWGAPDEGFYVAALYEGSKTKFANDSEIKTKGFEAVIGYTFDFGLSAVAGYELLDTNTQYLSVSDAPQIARRVPVILRYAVADSFEVWAEAEFDANSSKNVEERGSLYAAGARYTF